MPLNLFYTMVQKSQKWPKTQIKGGSCLNVETELTAYDCCNLKMAVFLLESSKATQKLNFGPISRWYRSSSSCSGD